MILPKALALLERHRQAQDKLLIITATNTVVTRPIANRLGVEALLGCEAEIVNGRYTGEMTGIPSFQQGKVERLHQWAHDQSLSLEGAYFYSDSHNDLPLLEHVTHPVAVDPDATLLATARARGWPVISLRE
jgi:HAD superfamily hydrolase (TIGR01490 family)